MDWNKISKEISRHSVVCVGESTHGSHEFFASKVALFKNLVTNHGFNTFMIEDESKRCEEINEYIDTGEGNALELIGSLYKVWVRQELLNLIKWLREIHTDFNVKFVGFDIVQNKQNIHKREVFMANNILTYKQVNPKSKIFIWTHNYHAKKWSSNKNVTPMGKILSKALGGEYFSVAQYFGLGEISVTLINKSNPSSKDRTLHTLSVEGVIPHSLESSLNSISDRAYFLNQKSFSEYDLCKNYVSRSIGWGVYADELGEYTDITNVFREFDGIFFFPVTSPSREVIPIR